MSHPVLLQKRHLSFLELLELKGIQVVEEENEEKNYLNADVSFWTNSKFPWDTELKETNSKVFGHNGFRMNQVSE